MATKLIVSNYPSSKIKNFNAEQISILQSSERQLINNILNNHKELMNYFRYEFIY